ncbi:lipase family protein [Tistrella bauzanensis]
MGVADACAPSWTGRSKRDVDYLGRWLKEGFAIVATDYQGLGVSGPHPYLATPRSLQHARQHSRRAVGRGGAGVDLGDHVVLIGQSQGGGAAFATAAFAPDYAPDIDIRGTVSTGIPFLTPQLMTAVATANPDKVDPTIAYLLYIGLLAEQAPTHVPASSMFTAKAAPVLDKARTGCVVPVFNAVTDAGLTRANTMTPKALEVIQGLAPSLAYPTVKLAHPLFVGTGAQDHDVPPPMQKAVVDAACAAGTVVEAHVYPGLDHSGAVNGSLGDSVPFVRKVMAGRPVTSTCGQPAS